MLDVGERLIRLVCFDLTANQGQMMTEVMTIDGGLLLDAVKGGKLIAGACQVGFKYIGQVSCLFPLFGLALIERNIKNEKQNHEGRKQLVQRQNVRKAILRIEHEVIV